MFERIKCKLIFFIRKFCGYYELESICNEYKKMCFNYSEDFKIHTDKINKLESKLEAKILEQDIIEAKLESKMLEYDILDNELQQTYGEILKMSEQIPIKQNKYLIRELEVMLKIMKNKGIHLQDLINKTINEAKRQLNRLER